MDNKDASPTKLEFNAEKYAELLLRAMGGRSATQFAKDMGIEKSTSTITRVLNKQNKRPSSLKLLNLIANNADKESGVTLELLKEANGMIPQKNVIETEQICGISELHEAFEKSGMDYDSNDDMLVDAGFTQWKPDIYIMEKTVGRWVFDIEITLAWMMCSPSNYEFDDVIKNTLSLLVSSASQNATIRDKNSDIQEGKNKKIDKYSIIVNQSDYDFVKELIKTIKSDICISVIGIDYKANEIEWTIAGECCCLNKDGVQYDSYFG